MLFPLQCRKIEFVHRYPNILLFLLISNVYCWSISSRFSYHHYSLFNSLTWIFRIVYELKGIKYCSIIFTTINLLFILQNIHISMSPAFLDNSYHNNRNERKIKIYIILLSLLFYNRWDPYRIRFWCCVRTPKFS